MADRCAKCGYVNSPEVAVCAQCAAPLVHICPTCGFENPAKFRFCGNCGASFIGRGPSRPPIEETRPRPMAEMPAELADKVLRLGKQIEGERRTVTVLFADISGFTSISEQLDPEEVYSIVDSTLKAFTAEIYKHEGTIDKYLGDGVMALFGAPVAHEDDAARAVRAAIGMQKELQQTNREVERRLGISLKVRIGLNSGTVVVGSIGSDLRMNYTALGDTVNVAARLQSMAEPGAILVCRPVYEQTRSIFEFRELGSIRVKGRVEPVELFEVLAPRHTPGALRGIPGLAAPMVGRTDEFARLRRTVDELLAEGRGGLVLVTGDAGIGKSRLRLELKGYLSNKPVTVIEGACLSYGQPAYGVFLSLLRSCFQITDDDTESVIRDKIERSVGQLLPLGPDASSILPYIEKLLSVPIVEKGMAERVRHLEPARLQQQTFLAVRDLFTARARQRPLVLMLEDIHWIDKLSLDLLIFLLQTLDHVPLLIYCNSRRGEGPAASQIQKLAETTHASTFVDISLPPLSHADSVALVDLLLTIPELPEHLKQTIPLRAEGNPFFLEEIIRMLIDRGIVRRTNGHWQIPPDSDLANLEVPRTLEGLIMARVDHLSEAARRAIQYASVIGRGFSFRLLSHVAEDSRDLEQALSELEERELISRVPHTEEREYRFHHVLIQETVYNSLLRRRRERLHEKIAGGIEHLFQGRIEEHVEELAFHYGESKDAVRALPYLIWAGRRAADRYANDQALRHYRLAEGYLQQAHATLDQQVETYEGLGNVETLVGDYAGALKSYLHALDLVRALDSVKPPARAEMTRRVGRVYERRGENAQALEWLERALKELNRDPDSARAVERVRIYNDIAWVHYRRGQFEEAYQWRMKSLQIAEGTEHYNELASAYNGLVALFVQKGDWARCRAYAQKALQLREAIGDSYGVSQSHTNLGIMASLEGDWDRALVHFEQSLEIAQKIGYVAGVSNLNCNLASLYRDKGDYSRAQQLFRTALQIAERIKNGNLVCQTLNNLAHLQVIEGQFDQAAMNLARSLNVASEMGSKEHVAEAEWLLAETYLGGNQLPDAESHARRGLKLAGEIGSRLIEGETLRTLAKIARAQGNLQEAEEPLRRSMTIFSELRHPFELAKSEYQLALWHRDRGDLISARALLESARGTFARLGAEGELRRTRAELDGLTSRPDLPLESSVPPVATK